MSLAGVLLSLVILNLSDMILMKPGRILLEFCFIFWESDVIRDHNDRIFGEIIVQRWKVYHEPSQTNLVINAVVIDNGPDKVFR